MRIGIFSDIHGDAASLLTTFAALEACDSLICLGDIVGEAGESAKAMELVRSRPVRCLMGNHDLEASQGAMVAASRCMAELLTRSPENCKQDFDLGEENHRFLCGLQMSHTLSVGEMRYGFLHSIHGRHEGVPFYEYVTKDNALSLFSIVPCHIVFVGHTHIPAIHLVQEGGNARSVKVTKTVSFGLEPDRRIVINVGSVGASRIRGVASSHAILDTDSREVRLVVTPGKREMGQP